MQGESDINNLNSEHKEGWSTVNYPAQHTNSSASLLLLKLIKRSEIKPVHLLTIGIMTALRCKIDKIFGWKIIERVERKTIHNAKVLTRRLETRLIMMRSGKSMVFAIASTTSRAWGFDGQSNILYITSCFLVHSRSS